MLAAWRSCDENGRAFILAINEWPLFELRRLARAEGFDPVDEAVRQVQEAVYYGDTARIRARGGRRRRPQPAQRPRPAGDHGSARAAHR